MSLCNPCQPIQPVPDCHENLVIGTMPAANTDYYIYVRDNTTGRTVRLEATSDGANLLTVANTIRYAVNHTYEIWVTLKTAASEEEREDIQVSGALAVCTCITLRVTTSYTADQVNSFTTVTLTAA